MSEQAMFCFYLFLLLICSAGHIWSLHRFCIYHFACGKSLSKRLLFFCAAVVLLPTANALMLSGILPSFYAHIFPLLWQILIVLWMVLLYQGHAAAKVSAAAILLTVTKLLHPFINSLFSCMELLFLHVTRTKLSPLADYAFECLVCCMMYSCSICAILYLSKHMDGFFSSRIPRWYLLISAPLFGVIILWDVLEIGASHGILLRGGDYLNLYYNQIFSHAGICLLSVLCLCAAGSYIFGMDRIDTEQRKKEQYLSQVNFYQMLEEQYHSLERLRHDMKNHMIGLQRLIDNKEWDKATSYLQKMAQAGGMEYPEDMSGKGIVDALLYYKHNQAMRSGIRWECDVCIPPECTVDGFDLCVMFGNILDNALEACGKTEESANRFIRIHAHMVKKCLFLETVNSTNISTISDIKPGIGLQNLQDTINKYNGTLSIDVNENAFRISVLLPFM